MNTGMQVEHLIGYHIKIPMTKPFRISVGEVREKEFVVFEGIAGGISGWGEAAVDAIPFYTSETAGTALHIAQRALAPIMKSKFWSHPGELAQAFDAYRGHMFTKAALETVLWDIYGKQQKESVANLLADDGTTLPEWVEAGPSLGIKNTPQELVDEVGTHLAQGWNRIKIKVSPGKDIQYIKAVRQAYPDCTLMVDANSGYQPADIDFIASWDQFNLLMIEQPLDHDDLYYHAQLCKRTNTPICLDESIISPHIAQCAIAMRAADIINIKVGRVGGLTRAKEVHDLCQQADIPVWIGGRIGSGIAEAMRIAAAALPNATLPSDIGFGREYMSDDLIQTWFETQNQCFFKVPTQPGLGIELNRDKLEHYTVNKKILF